MKTLYFDCFAGASGDMILGAMVAVGVEPQALTEQLSLLGVRGTEDLGGGLKAFFQLETAFKPDQNDTGFAARNSGVGLQGAWGSVLLGRWHTPYKVTVDNVDPFETPIITVGA